MSLQPSAPPAIIFVNNDLVDQVRDFIVTQLAIDEFITGEQFDARVAADPNYPDSIKALNLRLMVIRDFREQQNREFADLVLFVKNGLISTEKNKFGPPINGVQVLNVHWGQLCFFIKDNTSNINPKHHGCCNHPTAFVLVPFDPKRCEYCGGCSCSKCSCSGCGALKGNKCSPDCIIRGV